MMGVYIKGMEMPKACVDCFMRKECFGHREEIAFLEFIHGRSRDCPLVEVPQHGDLIDRDELAHEMWLKFCENCIRAGEDMCNFCTDKQYIDLIVNYPATISAERSEA